MDIRIIGRPGSKAVKNIVANKALSKFSASCDIVVNYGLAGEALDKFYKKHPSSVNKPTINKFIGCSKYQAIKDAEEIDVKTPKTFKSLSLKLNPTDFLTKKLHSQGGVGIKKASSREPIPNKYYQEYITNRKYELRVHGFLWLPKEMWIVQKRFGLEGEIAWNFNKGGRFQTIKNSGPPIFEKAKEISKRVMEQRKMSFGATDFIVTTNNDLLFLEINSAPGFTELSEGIYINAFKKLKTLTKTELLKYCR